MSEEDFEAYNKKMKVLLDRQKYGGNEGDIPDADRSWSPRRSTKNKETAKEEGEMDFPLT